MREYQKERQRREIIIQINSDLSETISIVHHLLCYVHLEIPIGKCTCCVESVARRHTILFMTIYAALTRLISCHLFYLKNTTTRNTVTISVHCASWFAILIAPESDTETKGTERWTLIASAGLNDRKHSYCNERWYLHRGFNLPTQL